MYIVDSHCDSICAVDDGKYGLVNPYNFSQKHNQLQFVAMYCSWQGDTPEESYRRTVRYIGHFSVAMANESDKILPVKTYADIERAFAEGKHAALLAIEGGSGIKGNRKIFKEFYNVGVRVFGLAWLSNDLAKSNRLEEGEEDTGLTELGKTIIADGNELGMIFDVSHLSDKSFWDTAELSKKPIIASHSNFRTLCGHSRNLTDEMAKEIFRQDGMIGLNLCTAFIHEEKSQRTVEMLFKHLDHCLSLGGEDHIGFGGDIDGIESYPAPLTQERSVHDQLIELMLKANYSEELVKKVAYENYMRFLKKYL